MLKRVRTHLTFANVISLTALFIALGGGAYALSRQAPAVRGGGTITSRTLTLAGGAGSGNFLKLPGIGKLSVSCYAAADGAGFGLLTGRHAAIVTTTGSGGADSSANGRMAGHHHGFVVGFGPSPPYRAGQAFIQVSSAQAARPRTATVTLSVLNGGAPGVTGIGNNCAFQGQATVQP